MPTLRMSLDIDSAPDGRPGFVVTTQVSGPLDLVQRLAGEQRVQIDPETDLASWSFARHVATLDSWLQTMTALWRLTSQAR